MASADEPVVLWYLRGHGRDVRCLSQRTRGGLELRVLWGDELFLTETFHEPARLMTRADEFRATLEARGWKRLPVDAAGNMLAGAWLADDGLASGEPAGGELGTTPLERAIELPDEATGYEYVPPDPGRRPTVLIVDDETTVRTFMRTYLEEAEYAVCEAADVDGALNTLDESPVDAVVLDVRMPDPMGWGRTGLEVLAFIRLHAAFAALPVLVLTGHPLDEDEQAMITRHRAYLFLKPDGYRQLLQRLDQLTGRREIRRH